MTIRTEPEAEAALITTGALFVAEARAGNRAAGEEAVSTQARFNSAGRGR